VPTSFQCVPESALRYVCDRANPERITDSRFGAMTLADFVEIKFVPEYVTLKRPAGRAHFYGILKHIVTPERVDRAFGASTRSSNPKPSAEWPYMDSLRLFDVTRERIEDSFTGDIPSRRPPTLGMSSARSFPTQSRRAVSLGQIPQLL
jgi:hypothetical protein